MSVTLTVPWPPSVNHYKKIGRIVKTKKGKLYQIRSDTHLTKAYYYNVQIVVNRLIAKYFTPGAFLEVTLYLYPPDKRKRDIDNILKVLLDSLVHSKLIEDDCLINKLIVERCTPTQKGKVTVVIHEIRQ